MSRPKLIVVSNHLPLALKPDTSGELSFRQKYLKGLTSAVQQVCESVLGGTGPSIRGIEDYTWIGMPPVEPGQSYADTVAGYTSKKEVLLEQYHCAPVIVSADQYSSHLKNICQDVLWPVFHYRLNTGESNNFDEKSWGAHLDVMHQFAKAICEIYREGDTIWIHDYHLMMLPSVIRRMITTHLPRKARMSAPLVRIGFYLYTPFPSCSIFPMLPVRKELLEGMLGSSLLGFQTYEDMNNFLTTCTRILGLDFSPKGIEVPDGRLVSTGVYPLSIDPEPFKEAMMSPEVAERIAELKRIYSGRMVMVGRDRDDQVEGVANKLRTIETFLGLHKDWVTKVVYFQVCPPQPPGGDDADMWREIHEIVGRINGQFGTADFTPVHFLSKRMEWAELVALYCIADVAVVTPLGDGYTATPLEFTLCQNMEEGKHGVLVLSEFAAAAQSLSGALQVNPWSKREVAHVLNEALTLPEDERRAKQYANYQYVSNYTTLSLTKTFLSELSVRVDANHSGWRRSGPPVAEGPTHSVLLDPSQVAATYRDSGRRLLLLNYDGALCSITRQPHLATPSTRMLGLLELLASDRKNDIYLVSGRDRATMDKWVGSLPVGLISEHGCFLKPCPSSVAPTFSPIPFFSTTPSNVSPTSSSVNVVPQSSPMMQPAQAELSPTLFDNLNIGATPTQGSGGWQDMLRNADIGWLDVITPVLEHYTERTPGSFIERKDASLVWHYRLADAEFSAFQAQELLLQLQSVVAKFPVEVILGRRAIEVKPKAASTSALVKKMMGAMDTPYDFVLCIGDDKTDEDTFSALEEAEAARLVEITRQGFNAAPLCLYTCTVRKRSNSVARHYIVAQTAVVDLLEYLTCDPAAPSPMATPTIQSQSSAVPSTAFTPIPLQEDHRAPPSVVPAVVVAPKPTTGLPGQIL
eukprot:TRINITY_DN3350_c0_g1_i1.p1 TRINITY_DN3350_c0_g1~~TRINITY_DN3350_c0_g1_i1.p1  ORF type:complete len:937 (-),score=209.23 TRINITY_DN3350_c0_g1_i1:51-2807(-)